MKENDNINFNKTNFRSHFLLIPENPNQYNYRTNPLINSNVEKKSEVSNHLKIDMNNTNNPAYSSYTNSNFHKFKNQNISPIYSDNILKKNSSHDKMIQKENEKVSGENLDNIKEKEKGSNKLKVNKRPTKITNLFEIRTKVKDKQEIFNCNENSFNHYTSIYDKIKSSKLLIKEAETNESLNNKNKMKIKIYHKILEGEKSRNNTNNYLNNHYYFSCYSNPLFNTVSFASEKDKLREIKRNNSFENHFSDILNSVNSRINFNKVPEFLQNQLYLKNQSEVMKKKKEEILNIEKYYSQMLPLFATEGTTKSDTN